MNHGARYGGLGKLGANVTLRLFRAGHRVVATDGDPKALLRLVSREEGSFAAKLLVARRHPFGGHAAERKTN